MPHSQEDPSPVLLFLALPALLSLQLPLEGAPSSLRPWGVGDRVSRHRMGTPEKMEKTGHTRWPLSAVVRPAGSWKGECQDLRD